jgi:hypothetical protein
MIAREHIENFLRLNGIAHGAPEDEIRSALAAARWLDRDIEIALALLRGDARAELEQVDPGEKLFRSDSRVSPDMLSALLGIDIHIHNRRTLSVSPAARSGGQLAAYGLVGAAAVAVAAAIIFFSLHLSALSAAFLAS